MTVINRRKRLRGDRFPLGAVQGAIGAFLTADAAGAVSAASVCTTAYRREAIRRNNGAPLIQAPNWAAATSILAASETVYGLGSSRPRNSPVIRRHTANNQLMLAVITTGTGTTGGTIPTFSLTAPMVDNEVTWVALGIESRVSTPYAAPTLTVSSGAIPAGYTEYLTVTDADRFLEEVTVPVASATFNTDKASLGASYNNGLTSDVGVGVGKDTKIRVVEIETDSADPLFTFWQQGNPIAPIIEVMRGNDGVWRQLSEAPMRTPAVGSTAGWVKCDWGGSRVMSRYRVWLSGSQLYRGIAVRVGDTIRRPVPLGNVSMHPGDSFNETVENYLGPVYYMMAAQLSRRLGYDTPWVVNMGGSGYVATNNGAVRTVSTVLSLNPLTAQGRKPAAIISAAGFNDSTLYVADPVAGQAAMSSTLDIALGMTNGPVLAIGPWSSNRNASAVSTPASPGANIYATELALASVVAAKANSRLVFLPHCTRSGGSVMNGTGRWSNPANDGNADFTVGTSAANGGHPSFPGAAFLAQAHGSDGDASLAALGR